MNWKYWIDGLLGLAVIGVIFLDLSATTLTWSLGIIGGIIAAVSFWGALEEPSHGSDVSSRFKAHV